MSANALIGCLNLLYENFLAVNDVQTLCRVVDAAALKVFGFDNAVCSQPKRYNLRLYYA